MKLKQVEVKELIQAARGVIPCDWVLTNVNVFNVFTGEILPANIYVYKDSIAHVDYELKELDKVTGDIVDGHGNYCIPGLIDAHMHVESTMLTPQNFAEIAAAWGTTTSITDPHEVANVVGVEGVTYMHDIAENLPMRQLIDIPSCVPSVHGLENAGAEFLAPEIDELSKLERVIGLAEVMDFVGVADGEEHLLDILEVAKKNNLYIQGHAPMASGRLLSAYIAGGPKTCHESRHGSEAVEKLRQGLYVDARESSMSTNVVDIWEAIQNNRYHDTFCLCTDDREAEHILRVGHMNDVVNVAIQAGMDPRDAIRSATFNSAREAHLENIGAIAPGYLADFLLVDDLKNIRPSHVFFEGKLVAKDQKLVAPIEPRTHELESRNTVFVKDLKPEDLTLKAPIQNGEVTVNFIEYLSPKGSLTKLSSDTLEVVDGEVILKEGMMFTSIVNRHPNNDTISIAIVKGFGNNKGCLSTTVSHDSHNITLVYNDPKDAVVAVNKLREIGGGFATVLDGEVIGTMALPVCGLMSHHDAKTVAKESKALYQVNLGLGMEELLNPVLRICTLALIVIPQMKMSDLGMVDVNLKKIIPVFQD
ncbi:adenine deaminase [Erysipelothrix inopinata]|uniref:Adenine deaminase n=1 Tax=Erysipelothrix inopinata TaxID=225084 RepID=A0A7G9RZ45_9FIRM|nr:adenine deaminase C-terminal domain-containing protein [Erysipelothrix inopinata]QNN60870.1 adenine deaminase [Erysipelothrix inopinata]